MQTVKVQLNGVHDFWIETEMPNIHEHIEYFEYNRGKYGFPRLTIQQKLNVIKNFIDSCTNTRIKYHTIYHKQLNLTDRTVVWLKKKLGENGYEYDYSTITRWIQAKNRVPSNVIRLFNILLEID